MVSKEKKLKNVKAKVSKYYIGVDVGGTSIKFGIFNNVFKIGDAEFCSGEAESCRGEALRALANNSKSKKFLIDKFSIDTIIVKNNNEKHLLNLIFDAIDDYCNNNEYGVEKNKIVGIGFAMPGPVVNNQLLHAVNINWTHKCDIVKITKKKYGEKVNVRVYNDANAANLGEYNNIYKEKYNSMCLITIGTGIGTGIIIDGKLVEGKTGIAGEVSHIRIDFSDEAIKCNCGNLGCIETVASCKGLVNVYNRLVKSNKNALSISPRKNFLKEKDIITENIEEVFSTKEIVHRAKKGDKTATKALNISLSYISDLIAILMHVYEPEVVVIGGGMSHAGTFITNIIEKHLKEKIFMTKTFPKIVIAKLKNDAGVYGAVADL